MSVAEKTEKKSGGLGETVNVIVQALLLALVIRTFLFQPFSIPVRLDAADPARRRLPVRHQMGLRLFAATPALLAADIFSGRIWGSEPERGDIVVFKFPPNPSLDYIKRVIGLPGDRIQMSDGVLFINGEPVEREKVGEIDNPDVTELNRPVDVYRETLPNGVSYETLDLTPNAIGDNTQEYVVPEGHYFMMGDNRDNSTDSRFAARRRLRAGREPGRPRQHHLLLDRGGRQPAGDLEVADARCARQPLRSTTVRHDRPPAMATRS